MRGLKSGNGGAGGENLRGKLEAIRRNKLLLETKIRQYEHKLSK
jgi:hypothetical protein